MYPSSMLGSQVLHGHWEQFLGGFGRLPWGDPRVPRALGAAALALVLALGVVPRLVVCRARNRPWGCCAPATCSRRASWLRRRCAACGWA